MGWAVIKQKEFCPLINWDENSNWVYFVHSFFVNPESKQIETSTINFGKKKLVSSIQFQNLFGVQFHPEKSGKSGLNIIKNFLEQI